MTTADATRLAVLIDSDNTTASLAMTKLSAMAKLVASDTCTASVVTRMAVLGGNGYLKEFPAERMMRDAKVLQIYLDLVSHASQEPVPRASDDDEPAPRLRNLKRVLSTAISSTSKDDGWSSLGEVGSYLVKSHAAFDPRDYGHSKLGELVRAAPTSK